MRVVCWLCHAWFDNARDGWMCPHEPTLTLVPPQLPPEAFEEDDGA